MPWASSSLQGDTFQICYLSPVQLQKLLCENIHSLRMAKRQGSFKADEHHIICTVDCASLGIRLLSKMDKADSELQFTRK